MRKTGITFVAMLALLCAFSVSAKDSKIPDSAIVQLLIDDSIASYSGNCPCPYNAMRNGRSCGKRSAYSKPGGYAPLCYKEDVTKAMIQEYRERMKG
ncbi:hypothetical protein K3169_22695 [Pseudomonas phytophila]|uniref:Uncharacterized protein n=1 Tax=Pseudomonas phytophila TaxID=2867264 RepID=A0ABY6FB72_9PSED|nr:MULTISPECIES: hypothetical protein [Pseudomonas]MCD5972711.1 hypothetical protein [Pseudomonas quasicaspiana]MCD5991609.1 hypothetical protein [Pseudomonas quasicaspiana]PHN20476.1 hypothetical protein AO242_17825 [Pseudomonas sp. ICMP 561]UXZ95119.1 hypothetical protein K3169_22695 [Pseudomonas phytophila]